MNEENVFETDVTKRLKEVTENGTRIGFDVRIFSDHDFLKGTKSLVLYTVGLYKTGRPEIVLFLGPREKSSPVPADDALALTSQMLMALNLEAIQALSEKLPITFVVKEPSPRRFLRLILGETQKAYLKSTVLAHLTAHYFNQSYDFVAYEADTWLH